MKKKRWFLSVVFTLALAFVSAQAFAFSLGGCTGPVEIKIANFEQINLDATEGSGDSTTPNGIYLGDNWGVFKVTSIEDPGANQLWFSGKDGEELTGIFYGVDVRSIVSGSPTTTVDSVGGRIDLYLDSSLNFDASPGPVGVGDDSVLPTYATVTDGTPFLSALFATGIRPVDDPSTLGFDETTTTVTGDFTGTSPPTGKASSYADVIAGSGLFASVFDSDGFSVFWGHRLSGLTYPKRFH